MPCNESHSPSRIKNKRILDYYIMRRGQRQVKILQKIPPRGKCSMSAEDIRQFIPFGYHIKVQPEGMVFRYREYVIFRRAELSQEGHTNQCGTEFFRRAEK